MSALSEDQELTDKLKLLQDSYKEVLDATKHQDDKVGRFLTAVSFLIGGSIALGTRTDLVQAAYQLEARPAQPTLLPAYLLSLFLLFIVVGLLLLVTGLGARLYRPGERHGTTDSHLFFFSIAEAYERDSTEWQRLWSGDSRSVGQSLTHEYQREIVNIARRARLKYQRTLYAGALLQFAILFLVLAAALGFLADGFPKVVSAAGQPAVDWSALAPRLTVAITVAAFALILSLDFFRFERYDEGSQGRMRLSFVALCPAYAAIVLLHPGNLGTWLNTFGFFRIGAFIQLVLVVAALVTSWRVWSSSAQRVGALVVAVVFVLGPAAFFAVDQLELGHLLGAGLVIALLLGMRLFMRPYPPGMEASAIEAKSQSSSSSQIPPKGSPSASTTENLDAPGDEP